MFSPSWGILWTRKQQEVSKDMKATTLDTRQFQAQLEENKPMLVEYWAPWCGYCRRIGPAYEQVAEEAGQTLTVSKINIDDEPALADREGIEVVPTLVLYEKGQAAGRLVAPTSKAAIDAFLQEHLHRQEGE